MLSTVLLFASYFAYLMLIFVAAVPDAQRRYGFTSGGKTRSHAAARVCAFWAAFFLPWSGVGVLPSFPTWLFYPLFGLSLLLNARRSRPDFLATLFALLVLALFVFVTDRFVLSGGLPGDRYSIESAGMILRLESIRSGKLLAAMLLLFAALFASFLDAYRDNMAGNVAAFAFSALLAIIFLPIDTVPLLNVFPPASVVLNFLLSFAAAIALQRTIRFLAARRRYFLFQFFLLYLTVAGIGGWLLLASI